MINNEITEIMNTEQKPELVQQPPITYTYPSDASRDERLKAALLALLNSDLIKVAGNKFTKQDLIEWVDRIPTDRPAEWSEENKKWFDAIIKDYEESFSGDEEHDPAIQIKINLLKFIRHKSLRPSGNPAKECLML